MGCLQKEAMEEQREQRGRHATAFEKVQLKVVWAWAMHFGFPQRILIVLCGYVQHQRRVIFEGCVADPLQTTSWLGSESRCSARGAKGAASSGRKFKNTQTQVFFASNKYLESKLLESCKDAVIGIAESVECSGF